jgi:DNA-binding LytR/AlgR family response regulator
MKSTIKCLIVDDEPIGREIIENFAKQINYLEVTAVCEDAFQAIDILQKKEIDLLITDIQMPKINGLEFVRALPSPPVTIFITAHENFAVNSYDLGVTDYLLKPVTLERFLKAVNKAKLQIDIKKISANSENKGIDYFFIKANNKLNKIQYKDILYIESIKDYIKVFTVEGTFVSYSSMKSIEEKLPSEKFIRIHKSYLVQTNAVKAVMGNSVELVNGSSITVSKSRKDELFTALHISNSR